MPARFEAVTTTFSMLAKLVCSEVTRSTRVCPWSEQATTA